MSPRPLSLFGLNTSHALAERVAARLGVTLAPHEEREYEDGEHKTRPRHDVRGHDVFVLHSLYGQPDQSPHDKLCRLLFFCGALRDAGAERVTAVTPYLCYARKDRRTKPHDPIATRYVATLFEAMRIDRLIAMEVHNAAAFDNAFRCPTWHVESTPLLAAHFATVLGNDPVVAVSPDAGGAKRAEQFRQALEQLTGRDVGNAMMEKFRSNGVVTGDNLAGDVAGKTAVIVDDMISTGGTLLRTAKACRAAGATRVFAAATHGLFIDGAPDLFATAMLDGIVVTDTVPPFRLSAAMPSRLTVLQTAGALAGVITVCHKAGR